MTSNFRREGAVRLLLCGCVALLLLTAACNQQKPVDTKAEENAVRETDAQWAKAASNNDVDGTVAFYADDAQVLPPNAPMVSGKGAIRPTWVSLLVPGNSLVWQANKVDVAASGDMAYVVGTYQLNMKDAQGNPVADHGKFVEVWKKQADGKWKCVTDIFNSDLPAKT